MNQLIERKATHATFTIERAYKAPPARVFAAWSSGEAKSHWFTGGPDFKETERTMDFRVGGHEILAGDWIEDGPCSAVKAKTTTRNDTRYEEIVTNERIIFSYQLRIDDNLISVSLTTVEFKRNDSGTRLVLTEQLTCLDGFEDADARDREDGTRLHLERLEAYLEQQG